MSSVCFYLKATKLKLPYSLLTENFKPVKAESLVNFHEFRDECIEKNRIIDYEERKANMTTEVILIQVPNVAFIHDFGFTSMLHCSFMHARIDCE